MEIIREFLKSPAIESVTVSTERVDFIREENPKLKKRNIGMDVGVYQKDSLSLDVDKTLYAFEEIAKKLKTGAYKNEVPHMGTSLA